MGRRHIIEKCARLLATGRFFCFYWRGGVKKDFLLNSRGGRDFEFSRLFLKRRFFVRELMGNERKRD